VSEVFDEYERQGAKTGTQTLSINTNVPDLFGGLHPDYVKQGILDRPRFEESHFATADLLAFEEGLDAPPRTLTSLKDLLTRLAWLYRDLTIPLKTRSVVILTNHDPYEIAKTDESVAALMERFPIVVKVYWNTHTQEDFGRMFDSLAGNENSNGEWTMPSWKEITNAKPARIKDAELKFLSLYFETAHREGLRVSPRTAVYAKDAIQHWAYLNGRSVVEHQDFDTLRFIYGLTNTHGAVIEKMNFVVEQHKQEMMLAEFARQTTEYVPANEDDPDEMLEVAMACRKAVESIKDFRWLDTLVDFSRELCLTIEEYEKTILSELDLR
jgi:hypothetical protein